MSEQQAEAAKTTIKKVVVSSRVVAEMRIGYAWRREGETAAEAHARLEEERCREFNDFVRDHRSMDDIRLTVERICEDHCAACGEAWDYDDEFKGCAYCGAELERPEVSA